MAHVIEKAKSGRAGCRKCRSKIAKDELRFGHEIPNQFDEGSTAYQWYHLRCAAEKLPGEFGPTLAAYEDEVPERAELEALVAANRGKQKPGKFPYAELAPSGRSSCLVCGEKIAKGEFRVAVEREIDAGGFTRSGAGYLHPACALQYEDVPDNLAEAIAANSVSLEKAQVDEVVNRLG